MTEPKLYGGHTLAEIKATGKEVAKSFTTQVVQGDVFRDLITAAEECERLQAKLDKLERIVVLAMKSNDAASEAEVAASASFQEAVAFTMLSQAEKERDDLRARCVLLNVQRDNLIRTTQEEVDQLRADLEDMHKQRFNAITANEFCNKEIDRLKVEITKHEEYEKQMAAGLGKPRAENERLRTVIDLWEQVSKHVNCTCEIASGCDGCDAVIAARRALEETKP